ATRPLVGTLHPRTRANRTTHTNRTSNRSSSPLQPSGSAGRAPAARRSRSDSHALELRGVRLLAAITTRPLAFRAPPPTMSPFARQRLPRNPPFRPACCPFSSLSPSSPPPPHP